LAPANEGRGGDIYLWPIDGRELVLVDALNAEAMKDMHRQGLAPAVTIQISPGRCQAWVKVPDHRLPEGLRKPAVAGLARFFLKGGEHGRLARFTNQKADPNSAGWQPYVLASEATGEIAPPAQQYLRTIELHIREVADEEQRQLAAEKARRRQPRGRGGLR
jgi:hypothetical protein